MGTFTFPLFTIVMLSLMIVGCLTCFSKNNTVANSGKWIIILSGITFVGALIVKFAQTNLEFAIYQVVGLVIFCAIIWAWNCYKEWRRR